MLEMNAAAQRTHTSAAPAADKQLMHPEQVHAVDMVHTSSFETKKQLPRTKGAQRKFYRLGLMNKRHACVARVCPEMIRGSREITFDLDGVASTSHCHGASGCSPI